jgi:hypothetical protein
MPTYTLITGLRPCARGSPEPRAVGLSRGRGPTCIASPYAYGWTCPDPDPDGARWRHPGASNPKSATIRHGLLFVYSQATPFQPTEPGAPHGYSKFRAWAVLEHHGDQRRRPGAAAGDGMTMRVPPVPTSPPRADGAVLLKELHAALCRYVVFPSPQAADATTLWVAATHAQPAWEHAPRLAVVSPLEALRQRCFIAANAPWTTGRARRLRARPVSSGWLPITSRGASCGSRAGRAAPADGR